MKRWLATILIGGMLAGPAAPATVFAQSVTKQVEDLSRQAAGAYSEGDYDRAIELFQQAYELQPVPNLLFNIAKVYEKKKDWEQAIVNYKEFMKAPDSDADARQVALDRIDALEEIRRVEREEEEARQRKLAEEERKKKEEEERLLAEQNGQETGGNAEAGTGGSALPWIVTGSGAALLIGGGVFGLLATDQETVFKTGDSAEVRRSARSKGKTFAIVADSMFLAGGVATVVGIILFATSGSGSGSETAATPTFWIGPEGGGAGAAFRF